MISFSTTEDMPPRLAAIDANRKTKAQQSVEIAGLLVSSLVAGIGFEPMTFRL
jgi:hypothetical protein